MKHHFISNNHDERCNPEKKQVNILGLCYGAICSYPVMVEITTLLETKVTLNGVFCSGKPHTLNQRQKEKDLSIKIIIRQGRLPILKDFPSV